MAPTRRNANTEQVVRGEGRFGPKTRSETAREDGNFHRTVYVDPKCAKTKRTPRSLTDYRKQLIRDLYYEQYAKRERREAVPEHGTMAWKRAIAKKLNIKRSSGVTPSDVHDWMLCNPEFFKEAHRMAIGMLHAAAPALPQQIPFASPPPIEMNVAPVRAETVPGRSVQQTDHHEVRPFVSAGNSETAAAVVVAGSPVMRLDDIIQNFDEIFEGAASAVAVGHGASSIDVAGLPSSILHSSPSRISPRTTTYLLDLELSPSPPHLHRGSVAPYSSPSSDVFAPAWSGNYGHPRIIRVQGNYGGEGILLPAAASTVNYQQPPPFQPVRPAAEMPDDLKRYLESCLGYTLENLPPPRSFASAQWVSQLLNRILENITEDERESLFAAAATIAHT